MMHDEWLILLHAYLSVAELLALRDRFGEIETITGQSEQSLRSAGLPENKAQAIASPDQRAIDATRLWLENDHHNIVAYGSDEYPDMLTQIAGAPLALFVNGDVDALHLP